MGDAEKMKLPHGKPRGMNPKGIKIDHHGV